MFWPGWFSSTELPLTLTVYVKQGLPTYREVYMYSNDLALCIIRSKQPQETLLERLELGNEICLNATNAVMQFEENNQALRCVRERMISRGMLNL
jgi:hypothetical protein